MRYTRCLASLGECRRHIAANERQRRRLGFAMWTVLTKSDGRIVGGGGPYVDPFDPDWGVELAYRFAPAAWGRGYATELARFSLTLGRDRLGLRKVLAIAHPGNAASRAVLEKAGF